MRIIAGKYRRRSLFTNPGLTTRPITDRVKESLFEHLNPWLIDAKVADIFSGTGTMGLEALSRGAKTALFIEKDKVAFDLLRKNVVKLGVKNDCFTWLNDVTLTSYRPKECERFLPYDIVFFDPPYGMVNQLRVGTMLFKSLDRLGRPNITSDNALVLLRTPAESEFQLPDAWEIVSELEFRTMTIHWLQKPGRPREEDLELPGTVALTELSEDGASIESEHADGDIGADNEMTSQADESTEPTAENPSDDQSPTA